MFLNFLKKKIKQKIYSRRSAVIKQIHKKFNQDKNLKYYVHSFGNKYPNKKFYVIQRHIGGGMFSNLNYVIQHISLALEMGCEPIIDMKNYPTKYNEIKSIKKNLNAWEYYFEPINNYRLEDVYKSKFVMIADGKTRKKIEFDTFQKKHFSILKKYIKIKKEILVEVKKFLKKNFLNKKVLGVHFRGTDMKTQERHPYPATLEQITSYIDYEIKKNNFKKIFLVTEELEYLKKLKQRYQDIICYYNSYRSIKADIFDNKRKNHRYLVGKENIIDMLILSNTQSIICTHSNLADASNFFRNFKIKTIKINNGYNSNNLLIAQFSWYVKKMLPEFLSGFRNKK